jgi:hypothetical protein
MQAVVKLKTDIPENILDWTNMFWRFSVNR